MLLRLTFLKACRLDVCFIKHYNKKRFIMHEEKKQLRQKVREKISSQNYCVSERGFVVLIKSVYDTVHSIISLLNTNETSSLL